MWTKNTMSTLLAFAAVVCTITSANAELIPVGDHSFEGAKDVGGWVDLGGNPVSPSPGTSTASVPSLWIKNGSGPGSGWTDPTQYSGGIPDGDIYLYANGGNYVSQTLVDTLQADTTYTLTVAVGWRLDLPDFGFPTFPGYGIELWAGSNLLASDYDTDAGNSRPAVDSWKDVTATYTSPSSVSADPLEIRLMGYGIQTNYDNVRLDATVIPEPSSFALLIFGLFAT